MTRHFITTQSDAPCRLDRAEVRGRDYGRHTTRHIFAAAGLELVTFKAFPASVFVDSEIQTGATRFVADWRT